jgi:hypothetical protein
VLLILPVRIDESLIDEAPLAHRGTRRARSPSNRALWSSRRAHSLGAAIEAPVATTGPFPATHPTASCTHAGHRVYAPDSPSSYATWLARPREDLVSL